MKKRGVSPVVATALLIGLTVVLATVIFFYSRQFFAEAIEKDSREISLLCEEVSFIAEVISGKIYIENTGSVPLYGVEIREKGLFDTISAAEKFSDPSVGPGETSNIIIPESINSDSTLVIAPMLLGKIRGESQKKAFICDDSYSKEVVIN